MLGYIGTAELLVIGAVLVFSAVPVAVVVFLATRKPRIAADQAKEIADLREEVGRLREHIARNEQDPHKQSAGSHHTISADDSVSKLRIGQR
ncbi:MAG: hypothetical protein H8F28_23705 [Fibrella sp.]|nr:hypothetical protein [Armatimonadota bacterium]